MILLIEKAISLTNFVNGVRHTVWLLLELNMTKERTRETMLTARSHYFLS